MEQGAAKANKSAGETMKLVREAMGLNIFDFRFLISEFVYFRCSACH